MNIDSLQQVNQRVTYIQMNSYTKYLSEDWLIKDRHDTFAIYMMYKAAG